MAVGQSIAARFLLVFVCACVYWICFSASVVVDKIPLEETWYLMSCSYGRSWWLSDNPWLHAFFLYSSARACIGSVLGPRRIARKSTGWTSKSASPEDLCLVRLRSFTCRVCGCRYWSHGSLSHTVSACAHHRPPFSCHH